MHRRNPSCLQRRLCWLLNLILVIALLIDLLPLTGCEHLARREYGDLPPKLNQYYATLDERFDCNFDQRDMCQFSTNRSSWSFHQSLQELAEKFQKAALAAANALQNNASAIEIQTTSGIDSVVVNYFPCAVAPRHPDDTLSSSSSSSLDLSIPWPLFTTTPINHSDPTPTQVLSSPPPLLACVHLHIRFPRNRSSHVNISFPSLLQELDVPRNHLPPSRKRHRRYLSAIHLDQSLFIQPSSVSQGPGGQGIHIPPDVWIEVTVPVHIQSSVTQNISSNRNPLDTFTLHGSKWVAWEYNESFRLQATSDVCVDNFLFRIWAHRSWDVSSTNTCLRSLVWRDPVTEAKQMLLIDKHGLPIPSQPPKYRHPVLTLLPVHHANKTYHVFGLEWFPLTGSLILAVSTTLLFLLLVIAVGVSVCFAHHRHVTHTVWLRPPRQKRPLPPDSPDPGSASLLSQASSEKFASHPIIEPESGSVQCDESLFHNSSGTYRSSHENHESETSDPSMDVASTSAVQLMRNWYFYRRRGERARKRNQPPYVRPAKIRAYPVSAAKRNHERLRVQTPNSAVNHLSRRSLVMTTDTNNQLIFLPAPSAPPECVDHQLDSIPETLPQSSRPDDRRWLPGSVTPSTTARSDLTMDHDSA